MVADEEFQPGVAGGTEFRQRVKENWMRGHNDFQFGDGIFFSQNVRGQAGNLLGESILSQGQLTGCDVGQRVDCRIEQLGDPGSVRNMVQNFAEDQFFARLMGDGMSSIREVNAAIERFYAEKIRPRRSA